MPDRPNPAVQANAIVAAFAARLAPPLRDACQGLHALGVEMAKRAPSIEKAAQETFTAFAVAARRPVQRGGGHA